MWRESGASAQVRDENTPENEKEGENYLDQNKRAETGERSEFADSSVFRSSDDGYDLRSSALPHDTHEHIR